MLPAPRDHASHAPRDPAPPAGTTGHDPDDLLGDSSLVARVALMGDEQAADRLRQRHEPGVGAYADHLGAPEGAALLENAWTRLREGLRLGSGLDVPVRVAWLSLLHQASSGSRVPRPWAGGNAAWTAFLSLPPAWQVVLWHVEVEQDPPEVLTTLTGADAASVERWSRVARGVLRRGVVRRHLPALREASCLRLATGLLGDLDATSSPVELQHLHNHGLGCSSCEHLSADVLRVEHDLGGLLAQRILGSDADWYLGRLEPDVAAALLATAATASVTDPGPATDPVPVADEEPAVLVPVAATGTPPAAARPAVRPTSRPSSGPAGRPAAGPASRPPSRPAPARRRSGSLVVGLATAAVVAGILGGLRGGAPLEADLEAGGRGARVAQDAAVRADAAGREGGAGRTGAGPADTVAASGPAVVPASTGGSGAAAVPASLGTPSGGPVGSPGAGPGPGPGGGPGDGPQAPGDPGGEPDGPPDGPSAEQEPVSARVDPDSGSATVEVRPPLVGGGTSVTTPPLTGPRPAAR